MKYKQTKYKTTVIWNVLQQLHKRLIFGLLVITFLLAGWHIQAQTKWPGIVASKDGVLISYEAYGTGEPTLVFVHGWSCDSRYWRNQIPVFSQKYKVLVLDLAGHGHSGIERDTFSMKAFGEDVTSVVEATGSSNVILIGHSMGGSVIAEAACLMPERVKGLIGVDTYENVEYPLSSEELNKMLAPFQKDFKAGTRQFVRNMLLPDTNEQLSEWILADMSAAPPSTALCAMKELMTQSITGKAAGIFEEIAVPVITVNGDLWPINYEANRRHMRSFEAIVVPDADHFLMMNRPEEFNSALNRAIKSIIGNGQNYNKD
ncbi:alpha/beta fold hydrolase [Maribellus maritimus]|uniref:alpha/beta fold hydrolase n=1 Tax=Maribellus maritimus TaxID=2870838 RepID=UPI001EEC004E|nr:alpha/beta hydrolase [Maribellus maritimus]MCG6186392.1 alpha/beta hydrolase [Maribellus maritimus]